MRRRTLRGASALALALLVAACTSKGRDVEIAPAQDVSDVDSGLSFDLPAHNEILADLDAAGPDGKDAVPETRAAECTNHTFCPDEEVTCTNGIMNAALVGHIPCWVGSSDCALYGDSWPCLSGKCGDFELCQDDIDYLEALVPDGFQWSSGKLDLEIVDAQGWKTCTSTTCVWEVFDGSDTVFRLDTPALWEMASQVVEGTTHLVARDLSGSPACKLELQGVQVDPVETTLLWAPLQEFVHQEGAWSKHWPLQGRSGALQATLADGSQLTLVWLWEKYKVRYAVHTLAPCPDGNCGCVPSCEGDECGPDGCGGTCGLCKDGLQCLTTKFGRRCTTECEPFTCPDGQLCLFGVCVDQECTTDDDCGGAPEHYCDKFLQCRKRTPCQTTLDCKTWNKPHYCDVEAGFCMEQGNCWEDSDCSGGTCGADHWCFGHDCFPSDSPACPPYLPLCIGFAGDPLLCEGEGCGSCVAPCIYDSDCPEGKECQGSTCNEPSNDCILDSECAPGQYCHPGCVALKPACSTESDCTNAQGKLCIAGFCGGPNEILSCKADAPCLAWREGYTCQDGVCKPEGGCVLDSQCPDGHYCGQVCLPIPSLPECKTDAVCTAGMICDNQKCVKPPECSFDSQCPAGHVCEDHRCYNDTGVCAWLEKGPGFCDDGDPCTVDACDAVTGCTHAPGGCP